ncbi:MAG: hypothetical protein ABJK11_05400 [Balneola sp.]
MLRNRGGQKRIWGSLRCAREWNHLRGADTTKQSPDPGIDRRPLRPETSGLANGKKLWN